VTEELNMYEDTPTRKASEIWMNLMYGDQPAGWDIGGTKNVIKGLDREDFIKYRARHYIASKTIVVISGSFNFKRAEKLIRDSFGSLPKKSRASKTKTQFIQKKPRAIVRFKKSEQDHLVLGVPGINAFDKRRHTLYVLGHVLGGGMSSRLFHRIREELGAAYYVRASSDESLDHGEFAVSSGSAHPKTELVIKAILEEFERLKRENVPAKELTKVKDHLTSGIVMGLETSEQLANFYGIQELIYKKTVSPEEVTRKIQAVSAKEVRTLAKELFRENMLNLAVIGPYKNASKLKSLLKLK
jgi:predicted Zn-dependent peptidase